MSKDISISILEFGKESICVYVVVGGGGGGGKLGQVVDMWG